MVMVDFKKTEIYKLLKEAYPNLQDATFELIVKSSIDLIHRENADITFPLTLFLQPDDECDINNEGWKWLTSIKK